MFSVNHTAALIIRIMITYITHSFEAVNKTIAELPESVDMILFKRGTFTIRLVRNGAKGSLIFVDTAAGIEKEFKINSKLKPINRRVTGDMEVWYHRVLREKEVEACDLLANAISNVDIEKSLKTIPFMSRLLGRSVTIPIDLGVSELNYLLQTEVKYTVSIFGKAKIFESVTTPMGDSSLPLAKVFPTSYNQFSGYVGKDPLNRYAQQVITDHLTSKLR